MEKFTLYTSFFSDSDKQKVKRELMKGNMVCVYPDCINKERAARVKHNSEQYLKDLGAQMINEVILDSKKFYAVAEHTPIKFVRLSDVQAILDHGNWLSTDEMRKMLDQTDKFDQYGNLIKSQKSQD